MEAQVLWMIFTVAGIFVVSLWVPQAKSRRAFAARIFIGSIFFILGVTAVLVPALR